MRRLNYHKKIAAAGIILALGANGILSYAAETGTITTMSETIYSEMDTDSNVIARFITGHDFPILGIDYDLDGFAWYIVETDLGEIGYIQAQNVSIVEQTSTEVVVPNTDSQDNEGQAQESSAVTASANTDSSVTVTDNVKYRIETSESINIRKSPSLNSEVVGKMPRGVSVESISVSKNENGEIWFEITYNGITGYVMSSVVNVTEIIESETETETTRISMEEIDNIKVTTTTNSTSSTKTVNDEETETVPESENTEEEVKEEELNNEVKTKSRSNFSVDWVAVFSFLGSLLCIGILVCLIKKVKKLGI